jgi:hypothetical protein
MQGHNNQHLPHKFTKLSEAKETKTPSIPVRGEDPFHSICGQQDLGEKRRPTFRTLDTSCFFSVAMG